MQNKNSSVSEFKAGMEWLEGNEYQTIFNKLNNRLEQCQDPVNRALITLDCVQEIKSFYDEARGTFNQAIVQNIESQEAYFYKGISSLIPSTSFWREAILDDAMAQLNTASIMNRDDPLPYYVRGKIWFYKHDLAEAMEESKRAVELGGDSTYLPDFHKQVDFLEDQMALHKSFEYEIGRIGADSIRSNHEDQDGVEPEDEWLLIDYRHRFKIRQNAILRQYVSPVKVPDETFSNEYRVTKEPHERVATHYKVKGRPFEKMDFVCGTTVQTQQFFGNEIWIKKSTLKHPYSNYFIVEND
jgi:tetratricopeptide (TPR) repeat protein